MTVATRATKATGQNQLSAVSATMIQSVPCSVRNMPDGFSRQSAMVIGTAAMRPASDPAIAPTNHDRARIDLRIRFDRRRASIQLPLIC